ncbi:RNA polymerase sigma factor [Qipengyuania marisflavi]|uniref:Sigma-70 family RNA polymerase sigma factor n=1 Tax=Qipengyuania marisflavi TaxID=2486356 RepID=A0A5S3P8Q1_9SPHN|nr:sigma-70 family RNA polymerase sigma factor [Qipengyuania marisflavi]TMM49882.1 sigma-70 family RNA polymerase sigma factor [Qipengyuania marisflavi]
MTTQQDSLYQQAGTQFAPTIARLARAMERHPERSRDLEQDIHCELWRSFARFDGRCSLKTWVYRIAHNVAADHRMRAARRPAPVPLDEIDELPCAADVENAASENHALARAYELIRMLPTPDAQVMMLWLEGESGNEIAEVTGLSANLVSTRIHRLKAIISKSLSDPSKEGAQT